MDKREQAITAAFAELDEDGREELRGLAKALATVDFMVGNSDKKRQPNPEILSEIIKKNNQIAC